MYKIISASNRKELEEKINENARLGYKVVGGITYIASENICIVLMVYGI